MIPDKVNISRKTVRLILTEEMGMRKICAQMMPRNLTEQERDVRLRAVCDIQIYYDDTAAFLLTWSRSLPLLFISKTKIISKRTPF